MSVAEIEAAVRTAWADTLGVPAGDTGWEEAGGDSLATLHFVYRLEGLLDRQLSFDLFLPELTPAELAAAIAAEPAEQGDDRPTMFLFPGVYGDEPALAAFRAAVAKTARFSLIEPVGFEQPTRVLLDVPATAVVLADEVERRQPEGPVMVGGYSFGGGVAYAVASELTARGRSVALTVVLDGALGEAMGVPGDRVDFRHRVRHQLGRVLGRLAGWSKARVLAFRLTDRAMPQRSLYLRRRLTRIYRTEARHRWRPAPTCGRVLLVMSEEYANRSGPVWRSLCPRARAIVLPAHHNAIFRGASLPLLCDAFESAVAEAIAPAPAC